MGPIKPEHLNAALALFHYAQRSAAWALERSAGDPLASQIHAALRHALPDGLTRTQLRDLLHRNPTTAQLDRALGELEFPTEHRKRIRTTNLLERSFVEVRRRTKVIGRFPGETSALSLIWAVLELSSRGWRGVRMTPKIVAAIERLRRELQQHEASPATVDTEEVIAA